MRRYFLICVGLLSCVSAFAGNTWHRQLFQIRTNCSIEIDGNIVACTDDDVYISTDEGNSWSNEAYCIESPKSANNGFILNFSAICKSGGNLVSINSYGIFISKDKGWHWEIKQEGTFTNIISWGDSVFACGKKANYLSTNKGVTWDSIGVQRIAHIVKTTSGFIANDSRNIFKSFDNGFTWIKDSIPGTTNNGRYSFYRAGDYVLAYFSDKMYRSSNDGSTWELINFDKLQQSSLLNFCEINNRWYAFLSDSVYVSNNSGYSWIKICKSKNEINNIVPMGVHALTCTDEGLMIFKPESIRFSSIAKPFLNGKLASFRDRTIVFSNDGVWYTTDHGINWQKSKSTESITNVSHKYLNNDTLVADMGESLAITKNAGQEWNVKYLFSPWDKIDVTTQVNNNNIFLIPTDTNEIIRHSSNYGDSWQSFPLSFRPKVLLRHNDNLFALVLTNNQDYKLMISSNMGNKWIENGNVSILSKVFSFGKVLIITCESNYIYLSKNFGFNWVCFSDIYPGVKPYQGIEFYDFVLSNGIYSINSSHGFCYSTDQGATWHNNTNGIRNYQPKKTDSFTFDGTTAYLSTDNGIYYANINMLSTEDTISEPSYNQVSPNPAKDFISIPNPEFGNIYRVVNIYGETVLEQRAQSDTPMKIGVAGLQPGVYFVLSTGSQAAKFIKE